MKKKIIYGLLFAVAMVTASSSFVSCKDYEGDDYAHWQEQLAKNEINGQTQLKNLLTFQISSLRYELTNALGNSLNGNYTDQQIKDWLTQLDQIENGLNNGTITPLQALNQLNQLASDAAIINESLKNLRFSWGDSLKKAYDSAYRARNLAYDDSIRLDTLSARADSLFGVAKHLADSALGLADSILNKRLPAIEDSLKANWKRDSINGKRLDALEDSAKANWKRDSINGKRLDALEDSAKDHGKRLNALEDSAEANWKRDAQLALRVDEIDSAYKAADKLLKEQLDSLCGEVESLQSDIDNILGTLKKQISGVIIQGTYCPVFGYGSLPLGVQTNILAAYASKTTNSNAFEFPTYVSGNYYNTTAVITGDDYDYVNALGQWPTTGVEIPANEILVDENKGNAGTMYLTVNPTNVNFKGTNFKLVNSQGQESRIVLDKLNASDKVMTFGWTRGTTIDNESANGFYEVAATIKADDALNMQPRFDKAGFKSAVTNALDGQRRLAVKELARAIYNSLEPLDRFGVKAEWTDTLGKRSVTSAFDIAAFSLEPLGFGFHMPNFSERYIRTIDKKLVLDKLHINMNIDPIIVTAEDKATGKYVVQVKVPAMYLDKNLVIQHEDGTFTYNDCTLMYVNQDDNIDNGWAVIDFTPMFEELFNQFNASFANFNNATDNLNKQIDDIAGLFNSYIDKANSYINRGNGILEKVYDLVKRAGDLVQPVLLWSDGKNVGELGAFVSANYAVGTVVPKGGQVKLAATSYSLELLAPSYKKSLIVTNAYKGGLSAQGAHNAKYNLEDAVKALNEQIKAQKFDVFSGQSLKNQFTFTANEAWAGITFEIAYTAVDFEGKCAGRKFYITVGE